MFNCPPPLPGSSRHGELAGRGEIARLLAQTRAWQPEALHQPIHCSTAADSTPSLCVHLAKIIQIEDNSVMMHQPVAFRHVSFQNIMREYVKMPR